jgi:hypothetical protein
MRYGCNGARTRVTEDAHRLAARLDSAAKVSLNLKGDILTHFHHKSRKNNDLTNTISGPAARGKAALICNPGAGMES